jgi:two-component system sensor kinase FixL
MKKHANADPDSVHLISRRRFAETLLDNLPGMAYRCLNNSPWTISFVSNGCEALTGHTQESVLGARLGWADFVHPDDRAAARIAVDDALEAARKFDIQYRIIDKFGMEKWVREQGCGVYDDSGVTEAIEGYIEDVTPLRNAVLSLANTEAFYEEEVRKRSERLRVTIENAPIGIVTYHCGGTFLTANRAFCEMIGYSAEELKNKTVADLTHPDHQSANDDFIRLVQNGEIDNYSQQTSFVRKDGSVVEVSFVNAVTHDANGRPSLTIGQVADLTSQIKAQAEIQRQHALLAHSDRLHILGEMATGIAHEINQPLTAISLFAQTGKRLFEAGDFGNLQEIFDKLSLHSQRAGAIVERIQGMAQQKEGAKQVVDLNTLIKDVLDLAEVDARHSNIFIELDLATESLEVEVEVVQIQQVALNLLRNSIDAMRSINCINGNTIQVSTAKRSDGHLQVAIRDLGCGVPDSLAEELFEPFLSTKNTGLGMGLPISKAIITAHGGQLDFRNNEVCGAEFSFTLPAAQGDPDG